MTPKLHRFFAAIALCPSACPSGLARDLFSRGHRSGSVRARAWVGLLCAFHAWAPPTELGGIGPPHKRIAISRKGRRKWPDHRSLWREAGPARPPKPPAAASAERLQRPIRMVHLDGGAGQWVDVEERLMASALSEDGRRHHAALSDGSARAKPRR
jgi:hypothetical protein